MSKCAELANLIGNINAGGGGVNRNLVINGKMAVSQRSVSATGKTTGAYYTIDRFRTDHAGFTGTYTQSTDVPSGYGFSNSFKIENTSVASSNGGTLRLDQRIEAQNLRNSGWDYTNSSSSLSYNFWAKSSVAGTYFVGFRTDDGTARQFTKAFTLSANTWTNVSFPISGDSNLTFNNDNGHGCLLAIHIDEATGQSDSGHTLDGWQNYSSSSRTPDFSQKWTETANATFLTTGWQLEVGQNPTSFEHEPTPKTLEKCKRYYSQQFPPCGAGVTNATNQLARVNIPLEVEMRTAPTISMSGNIYVYSGTHASTFSSLSQTWSTPKKIEIDATSAGTMQSNNGQGLAIYNETSSSGTINVAKSESGGGLKFDAEL